MTTGHVSVCVAVALAAGTMAVALTAHAGSSTTMQVNYAWDNRTPAQHDAGSLVVADLNDDADSAGYVRVWAGGGNWWEVALTDHYPVSIPGGSVLTSVLVTVQYNMENAAWAGSLILDARKGAGISLGTDSSWPEQPALAKQTWDITGLVNGEPEPLGPLDTLNLLRVRMYNMDAAVNVVWDFCEVAVQFEVPPDKPSITSPTAEATGASRTLIEASSFSDADGNGTHQDSDWEVYDDAGLAAGNRVAYSLADATNKESVALTPANVTFENSLEFETALFPNTENWALVRYRDTYGLESEWSDVRHFTTGLGEPPAQPTITSPSGTGADRRPTVVADAYSDPEGDQHASSDWEIFETLGPADRVAYRLNDTVNLTSVDTAVASLTFEGTLDGMTSLAPLTTYWVVVTYRDEYGAASSSAAVSFETAENIAPDTPTITSPSGAGASRTPTIVASVYNDDLDEHASSDWEVFDAGSCTPGDLVASSMADAVNLETIDAVPATAGGTMLFEGSLAGRSNLAPLTPYWVRVTYRDEYGGEATSVEVQFVTAANVPPAQPSIVSPAADEDGVPLNPVITADAFSDSDGDVHSATYWEVYENPGPADLVAAGANPAVNLTSIGIDAANVVFSGSLAGASSLEPSTDYWVVVTYRDGEGADSVPSAAVHFKTGDYPEGDTWPFFGSGCSPTATATPAGGRGETGSAAGAAFLALWLFAVLRLADPSGRRRPRGASSSAGGEPASRPGRPV